MPLFEMECDKCGRFEVSRKWNELEGIRCPSCNGKVRRVWSPFNFSFGWTLSDKTWEPGHKQELVRNI